MKEVKKRKKHSIRNSNRFSQSPFLKDNPFYNGVCPTELLDYARTKAVYVSREIRQKNAKTLKKAGLDTVRAIRGDKQYTEDLEDFFS